MNLDQTRKSERGTRNKADRLRALNAPHRVEVKVDAAGFPRVVGNRTVESLGEIWHIDDEWWRTPIKRRYIETIIEGGKRVVLYEDLSTGEWWMQKPA